MTPARHTLQTAADAARPPRAGGTIAPATRWTAIRLVVRYVGTGCRRKRGRSGDHGFMRGRLALWTNATVSHVCGRCVCAAVKTSSSWAILKPVRDTPHVEVGYRMPQARAGSRATPPGRPAPCSTMVSTRLVSTKSPPSPTRQRSVTTRADQVWPQRDGTLSYNGGGEVRSSA